MNSALLAATLSECAALLQRVGETFWSARLAQMATRGSHLSAADTQEIVCWFGGMGSFNDLVISRANDHAISAADESSLNDELDRMRALIYEEACRVVRS